MSSDEIKEDCICIEIYKDVIPIVIPSVPSCPIHGDQQRQEDPQPQKHIGML